MKKIIDGKIYNTDTATLVATCDYGFPGDFTHFEEGLYRTAKGAWFVAGKGGAMSHYGVAIGNGSRSGSNNIRVLSDGEAKRWLESYGETDALLEHFVIEEA